MTLAFIARCIEISLLTYLLTYLHIWHVIYLVARNEVRKALIAAVQRTNCSTSRIWSLFWAAHQRFFRQLWYVLAARQPTLSVTSAVWPNNNNSNNNNNKNKFYKQYKKLKKKTIIIAIVSEQKQSIHTTRVIWSDNSGMYTLFLFSLDCHYYCFFF